MDTQPLKYTHTHTHTHLPTWLLNRLGNGFLLFNVVWSAAPAATVSEGRLAVLTLAHLHARTRTHTHAHTQTHTHTHTLNPKSPAALVAVH